MIDGLKQPATSGGKMVTANSLALNVSWTANKVKITDNADDSVKYDGIPGSVSDTADTDIVQILDVTLEDAAASDMTMLALVKVVSESGNIELDGDWSKSITLSLVRRAYTDEVDLS